MTVEHFLFIPVVILLGFTFGYGMGAKAVRAEVQAAKKRAKR